RSMSQRAKKVLPDPYSPRTALNCAPPEATASSSSSSAASKRPSPTAMTSRPWFGTVPRRSASTMSRRRRGLTSTTDAAQLELLAQQALVEADCDPVGVHRDDGVPLDVEHAAQRGEGAREGRC